MAVERGRRMAAQPDGAPDAFDDSDCSGFSGGSCHTSRGGPATSTASPTSTNPTGTSPTGTRPTGATTPSSTDTAGSADHTGGTTEDDGSHGPGEPPAHRTRAAPV
jgi:hypothetical protein